MDPQKLIRVLANNREHDGAITFRQGWSDSNNKKRGLRHSPIRGKRAANPLSRSAPVGYKERIPRRPPRTSSANPWNRSTRFARERECLFWVSFLLSASLACWPFC